MLDLSLFHMVPKAVHLEDFVSFQNQASRRDQDNTIPEILYGTSASKPYLGGPDILNIVHLTGVCH